MTPILNPIFRFPLRFCDIALFSQIFFARTGVTRPFARPIAARKPALRAGFRALSALPALADVSLHQQRFFPGALFEALVEGILIVSSKSVVQVKSTDDDRVQTNRKLLDEKSIIWMKSPDFG